MSTTYPPPDASSNSEQRSETPPDNHFLTIARREFQRGRAVFPLKPWGKTPITSKGLNDRTGNWEQIVAWSMQWPDANVGIVPGDLGELVLDLDEKPDVSGLRNLAALAAQHGEEIEPTRTVRTPSGGRHLYYKGAIPFKGTASLLAPGVDTRGAASYVLAEGCKVRYPDGREGVYTVELDLPPAPLPEWVSGEFSRIKSNREARQAHAQINEWDAPLDVDYARRYLAWELAHNGPTPHKDATGTGIDTRTWKVAAKLADFALTETMILDLMETYWAPDYDRDWLETKVGNACNEAYRENGLGCDKIIPAAEVHGEHVKAYWAKRQQLDDLLQQVDPYGQFGLRRGVPPSGGAEDEYARTRREYLPGANPAKRGLGKPKDMVNDLYDTTALTPRRDLVPDLIEAYGLVAVVAPGGYHKSRFIQQVYLAKMRDRTVFQAAETSSFVGGGGRRCGGIDVGKFCVVAYEGSDASRTRRVQAMREHFAFPDQRDDCAHECPVYTPEEPLVRVDDSGEIELTDAGCELILTLEKNRGQHTLVWLDSFFDAVEVSTVARINDGIARKVVHMFNTWCRQLDCTILAPFHPSRSGEGRGDSGYAAGWEDKAIQVLQIAAVMRRVTGGKTSQYEKTDDYILKVKKWNDGREGTKIPFHYHKGQLVSLGDGQISQGNLGEAAAKVIFDFTYGKDGLDRFHMGQLESDRDAVERDFQSRVRWNKKSGYWEAFQGGVAQRITTTHVIMDMFRRRCGDPKATVAQFAAGIEQAKAAILLGHRDADRAAKSGNRLPWGCHFIARRPSELVVDAGDGSAPEELDTNQ